MKRAGLLGLVLVALVAVGVVATRRGSNSSRPATTTAPPASADPHTLVPPVVPDQPYGLAAARGGSLLIVDVGLDQVLKRLPSGRFVVVAGDGHQGGSGDGGAANKAELRLQPESGIVESRNGVVYIADSGNARVRAVLPNGEIETVAGNGRSGVLLGTSPPLDASIGTVAGLAIGRHRDLYIAASNVLRLSRDGVLHWLAGNPTGTPACGTVFCNPAGEYDFMSPDQLALDAKGNLFVSSSNALGLYEITAKGARRYLGQFRGNGGAGALAASSDGRVIESWRGGVTQLVPKLPPAHTPVLKVVATRDLRYGSKIDALLGANRTLDPTDVFAGGDGVAVAPNGDIYVDANMRSVSALLRLTRDGRATVLWKSLRSR